MTKQSQIYLDFGTGMHRKGLTLSDIKMDALKKRCLIGFHAFTGNDYVSSFFWKGKEACWKVADKNQKFVDSFIALGSTWNIAENTMGDLEEYVCLLYGCRHRNVNAVRKKLFDNKYLTQSKVMDISLLPLCRSSLRLHILRANVVARIWIQADQPLIELPELSQHGWDNTLEIQWIEKAFPDEIEELLVQTDNELVIDDDEGSDEDSEVDD